MIHGRDILYISSIDWDFLWQGPQEIARRLGAAGNRVLYLENTGVRAPRIAEANRVAQRLSRWARTGASGGLRAVAPNVYVYSPLVLPPFGSPLRRALNRRLLAAQVRFCTRSLGFSPSVIWTFLPTDTALDLAEDLGGPDALTVYYCVADFSQLTPHTQALAASERAIVRRSGVVFVSCDELADNFSASGVPVQVFPFGVDLQTFEAPSAPASAPPAEIAVLPRPLIGYAGALERAFDLELAIALARARPAWSFVYVGLVLRDVGELARLPNVHLVGQRPHDELPAYLRSFDVCIVPYGRGRVTDTVVPTKINEYLAVGKPVVSTDLPNVRDFEQRHRILRTSPPQAEPFIAEIEKALADPGDAAEIARRRQVAAHADWARRLEEMTDSIEAALAKSR